MRQINVKYPCVSTYEKHETWMSYHSCCSLYLLPKMTKCRGTEEIPLPPLIVLFSLDLLEFFEGSRDKAGLQAAVCETQASQIAEVKEPWCICCWFWGQKPGPLCSYLLHVPTSHWKGSLGCQSRTHPWKSGMLWATKGNRARQQVEELLEEIALATSHPCDWRKTTVFWKTNRCSKS